MVNWELVDELLDFGGIRIEDDVRITEDGCVVMSAALPKAAGEIEAIRREALGAGRMAERLTISDIATYPRPGMDAPGMIGFTPDSRAVTWLHAAEGGLVRSLWRIDVETGERSVIAGPGADAPMSREEELLRERTRTRELGVAAHTHGPLTPRLPC